MNLRLVESINRTSDIQTKLFGFQMSFKIRTIRQPNQNEKRQNPNIRISDIHCIDSKLMRLGLTNRIGNDSDSKPANFDHGFRSDSKSKEESELAIAILI